MRLRLAMIGRGAPRGFTMIEMLVVLGLFGFVVAVAMAVAVGVAKESSKTLAMMPAENHAQIAVDRIRYQVLQAAFGSVRVTNGGAGLEFINPTVSATTPVSIFMANNRLIFSKGSGAGDREDWGDVKTLSFNLQSAGSLVGVELTAPATYMAKPIHVFANDLLYVRN